MQQELADPSKIDRRVPDGPLGLERQKCDFAKRAVAYAASLGVQKYMQKISDKQELLGVLADCLIQIFAMDSAITRTLQLIRSRGEDASRIAICMTQLFVAKSHASVFEMLREMLMWMSQAEEWGREVRDINSYYELTRVNTFSLRRKIALHAIEVGGYAIVGQRFRAPAAPRRLRRLRDRDVEARAAALVVGAGVVAGHDRRRLARALAVRDAVKDHVDRRRRAGRDRQHRDRLGVEAGLLEPYLPRQRGQAVHVEDAVRVGEHGARAALEQRDALHALDRDRELIIDLAGDAIGAALAARRQHHRLGDSAAAARCRSAASATSSARLADAAPWPRRDFT